MRSWTGKTSSRRLIADLRIRPEGLSDLSAALRQVVADAPRHRHAGAPRARWPSSSPSGATARMSPSSRGTRAPWPRPRRAGSAPSAGCAKRSAVTRSELRMERGPDGTSSLAVSFPAARTARDVSRLAEEVFLLPARLADVRRRAVVVALDEFQAIHGFNGGSVEEALRAAVQHQRRVGYVFAGSEPSPDGADDRPAPAVLQGGPGDAPRKDSAGPVRRVHRVALRPHRHQARSRASAPPSSISPGNLPYDVQRLAHETWDDVRAARVKRVGLGASARHAASPARRAGDGLRGCLAAADAGPARECCARWCSRDGRELLAADTRARHRLGGASSVQAALAALVREDLVARDGTR